MSDEETPQDGLVHDEIEIEDFEYEPDTDSLKYPCPCGDEFTISREDLMRGEKYARCPSCSLMVQVIYSQENLQAILEIKSNRKESPSKTASLRAMS